MYLPSIFIFPHQNFTLIDPSCLHMFFGTWKQDNWWNGEFAKIDLIKVSFLPCPRSVAFQSASSDSILSMPGWVNLPLLLSWPKPTPKYFPHSIVIFTWRMPRNILLNFGWQFLVSINSDLFSLCEVLKCCKIDLGIFLFRSKILCWLWRTCSYRR